MENESMHAFEYVDRYGDSSAPRPDPDTVCNGQCEGMGVYPVKNAISGVADHDQREIDRIIAESGPSPDGWYFVRCSTCGGSGKRNEPPLHLPPEPNA